MLLDLVLPGMNGLRLLDHIRALRAWTGVPVVVVSGMIGNSGTEQRLVASGATAVIAKPFDPDRMRQVLGLLSIDYFVPSSFR